MCATSAGSQLEPVPLAYLQDPHYSSYDINLQVAIKVRTTDHASTYYPWCMMPCCQPACLPLLVFKKPACVVSPLVCLTGPTSCGAGGGLCAAPHQPVELPAPVLGRAAAAGAPQCHRLQHDARRPAGLRHHQVVPRRHPPAAASDESMPTYLGPGRHVMRDARRSVPDPSYCCVGCCPCSGSSDGALGSMLELSWKGSREVGPLPDGSTRKFLKDGDE